MDNIARVVRAASISAVRLYNRLEVTVAQTVPDTPVLFVANHGFGGVIDLNVFAFAAAYDELGIGHLMVVLQPMTEASLERLALALARR